MGRILAENGKSAYRSSGCRVTCSLDTPPHSWTLALEVPASGPSRIVTRCPDLGLPDVSPVSLGSSSSPAKCSNNDQVDDSRQEQEYKFQLNNNGHQDQNWSQGKQDQTNQNNLGIHQHKQEFENQVIQKMSLKQRIQKINLLKLQERQESTTTLAWDSSHEVLKTRDSALRLVLTPQPKPKEISDTHTKKADSPESHKSSPSSALSLDWDY